MVDLGAQARGEITRIAVVMDVRSRGLHRRPRRGHQGPRRPRLQAAAAVPGGHRRRADPPVRAGARSHPLQGDGRLVDGITAERELLRAAAGGGRPRRRHLGAVGAPSAGHDRARVRHRVQHRTARHGGVLRLQVRPADGLRPGHRRAVPAQPVLDPRVARPRPAATRRARLRAVARRAPRSSSTGTSSCCGLVGAGYRREGKRYLTRRRRLHRRQAPQRRHQRGARAAAGRRGRHGGQVVHRDLGRE